MPSISQLTNLSQQQYSPQIQGERNISVVQTNVFKPDTSKTDALAKDFGKLIKGIENYQKIKHDLSVDAVKAMARDHLINTKNSIRETLADENLSFDQKRQAISQATNKSFTDSGEFLAEDVELQKIYDDIYTSTAKDLFSSGMTSVATDEDKYLMNVKDNEGKAYLQTMGISARSEDLIDIYSNHIKRGLTNESLIKNMVLNTKIDAVKTQFNSDMYSVTDKFMDKVFGEDINNPEVKSLKKSLYEERREKEEKAIDKREKDFMSSVYESYAQDPSKSNREILISRTIESGIKGDRKVTLLNMLGAFKSDVSSSEIKGSINEALKRFSLKDNENLTTREIIATNNQEVIEELEKLKQVAINSGDEMLASEMTRKIDNLVKQKQDLHDVQTAEINNSYLYTAEGSEARNYVVGKVKTMENELMNAISENNDKLVNYKVAELISYTNKAQGVESTELNKIDGEFLNAGANFSTRKDAETFLVVANAVANSGKQTLYKSINDKALINKLNSLDPNDDRFLDRFNQIRTSWQVANSKITVRGDKSDVSANTIVNTVANNLWTRLDMQVPIGYSKYIISKELTRRGVENPLTEDEAIDLVSKSLIRYTGDAKPKEGDNMVTRTLKEGFTSVYNSLPLVGTDSITLPVGLAKEVEDKAIEDIFTGFLLENKLSPTQVRTEIYFDSKLNEPVVWVVDKVSGKEYGTIDSTNAGRYTINYDKWIKGK